ncbi:MAG: hypothetical protein NTV57_14935 [Cyanobacteria bacterium]|nr:hypothetical protein [Cyanobacteriota bacterium]
MRGVIFPGRGGQLLYRLSRIVLLGLVLYTAWLLITLQPDLAKRMSTTHLQTLQEQVSAHQSQVHSLLRSAIETGGDGLHNLALLQWDGGSSATVLAAAGRLSQQGLSADASTSTKATAALLCPVGCGTSPGHRALLLSLYDERAQLLPTASERRQTDRADHQHQRQEELLLLARRLGELLTDGGPGDGLGAGPGKSQ